MITNEIFRRVHPQGKTYGQYLREDIGPEFGIEGMYIGLPEEGKKFKVPYKTLSGPLIMRDMKYGPEFYPTTLTSGGTKTKKSPEVINAKHNWPEFK